jgi:hypothetical protein
MGKVEYAGAGHGNEPKSKEQPMETGPTEN